MPFLGDDLTATLEAIAASRSSTMIEDLMPRVLSPASSFWAKDDQPPLAGRRVCRRVVHAKCTIAAALFQNSGPEGFTS
jgi:hypothetical protein